MYNVLIFGGTTEGRVLCEKLINTDINVTLYVTTQYGHDLLPKGENINIIVKSLDLNEMINIVYKYDFIIDATHPYADKASKNIKDACNVKKVKYLRVIRELDNNKGDIYVESLEEAVDYLNNFSGNILLTTGSKGLDVVANVNNFEERVFPRVLPAVESIEKCRINGFTMKNIIAMQGPFTKDMNIEHIKYSNAEYIVTKMSGTIGGYSEKIEATREIGKKLIVIGRPMNESGINVNDVIEILSPKKIQIKRHFPMYVSLEDKLIRVFGGGKIASRRIDSLVKFNCKIEVIAPFVSDKIKSLSRSFNIEIINRSYEKGDVKGCYMVLGLTDNREVNHMIFKEAKEFNILCNIGDKRQECSFYFPGIVNIDNVVVGVTSSGEDHRRAKEITNMIKDLLR